MRCRLIVTASRHPLPVCSTHVQVWSSKEHAVIVKHTCLSFNGGMKTVLLPWLVAAGQLRRRGNGNWQRKSGSRRRQLRRSEQSSSGAAESLSRSCFKRAPREQGWLCTFGTVPVEQCHRATDQEMLLTSSNPC